MLFQLYDPEGNSLGLIRIKGHSMLYASKIASAGRCIFEHSPDEFWDSLIEALAKMDIVAERVFVEEINL